MTQIKQRIIDDRECGFEFCCAQPLVTPGGGEMLQRGEMSRTQRIVLR